MPASGLTSSLVKRRTNRGGSATSDTTLSHYASGPISHTSAVPGGAYGAPVGGSTSATAPVPAAITTGAVAAGSSVSAAEAAYQKQQNLLAKYVLQQAKKALVQKQFTFNAKGEATGMKESPRQFGEDLHQAAENIRKADYRKAGLSQVQKDTIQKANVKGKVVPLKGIARMSAITAAPLAQSKKLKKAEGSYFGQASTTSSGRANLPLLSGVGGNKAFRDPANVFQEISRSAKKSSYPSDLEFGLALASAPFPEIRGAVAGAEALSKVGEAENAVRATSAVGKAVDVGKAATRATKVPKALSKGAKSVSAKLAESGPVGSLGARVGEKAGARLAAGTSKGAKGIYGASLAAGLPQTSSGHKNPLSIPESLYLGTERAITAHPGETLATTARALPSVLTFPATLGYEAGKAVVSGGQDTSGLKKLGEETKGFLTHTGGELISGDPSQVQQAVQKEIGLSFLVPIPRLLGGERGVALREAARGKISRLTEHIPGSHVLSPESPKGIRRRVAVEARQAQRAPEYESAHFKKEVVAPLRKVKGKETIDGTTVTAADTIHLAVKYGIHRDDPGRVLSNLRDKLPQESAGKGVVTASQALTFLERHPEVLKNKNYWKAVDAAKASGEATLTSPRAKYLGIGDLHNITRPEDMVPVKAREFTQAHTRDEAFADVKERKATAAKLRSQAHDDSVRASALKGEQATKLRASAKDARRRAQELDSSAKDLSKALNPYTRPGQSLEGKRLNYDKQSLQEYVQKVQAAVERHGHEEPAHLPQVTIGHRGAGEVSRRFASGAKAAHIATMDELSHQHIDNSLRSLVSGGIERPRIQKGWHEFLKRFVATERQKIGGKSVITRDQFEKAIRDGEINPKHYVLLPSRDYHQAIKDRFTFTGSMSDDLNRRISAIDQEHVLMEDTKGTKYVVVHRQAAEELKSMLEQPGVVEKVLNANAKLWNRLLLGLSPGWELSQIVAEGLPIGIAHPELALKGPKIVHALNKLSGDEARGWASLAGESPRIIDQPEQLRPTLPENANKEVGDFVRATSRNPILRGLWSTARARPLGLFDRWRTGKYRSVLMSAELNKDLNSFTRGLRGTLHFSKETAAKLRDMPLHEQMAWLGKHPAEARKLQGYVDDVMGNWDAFSRFERQFAPALIFYPFVRYSLRWTFWSFPLRHPVKAQMLYFLGQMNSQELEKLLGAKPQNWTDYANPVLFGANGPSAIMPFGRRIAPGLSAPVETAGQGNVTGLLGALNPSLGVPIEALTGVNPLSGQQEATSIEAKGWLALNQLLSMPAPLRLLGLKAGPSSSSSVSQAFNNIDPNRQLRSALMPYLPLSAQRYQLQNQLDKLLTESGGKPGFSDFLSAIEAGDQAKVKSLIQQYKLSSQASKALDALLPSQPGEQKALTRTGKILNRLQFGPPPKPKGGGGDFSNPFDFGNQFSNPFDFGGGGSSKPSKPLHNVLKGIAKETPGKSKDTAFTPQDAKKALASIPNIGNSRQVAPTVQELATKYNLPPSVLMAQLQQESNFTPAAQSGAGAFGESEFMPSTASQYGVKEGTSQAAVMSQLQGQAHLMSDLVKQTGSVEGALNAYYGSSQPFTDASGTGSYASKVLAKAKAFTALDGGKASGGKGYTYPFSPGIQIGRTDMGIDPYGPGNIRTIGKAKYLGTGGEGWPTEGGSGTGPVYKLLKGPAKGQRVYTYEGITPRTDLKPGQTLKKGTVIAKSTGSSFETGFAQGRAAGFQPTAAPHYSEGDVTPEGQAFAKLIGATQSGGALPSVSGSFGTTGGSVPAIGATTGSTTPSTASVPPALVSTAKTSIAHADTLSATQKLRMVQLLDKPGGALKLLGIPGAFTPKGTLTTDGEKILATLSADRLRLLGTTSS